MDKRVTIISQTKLDDQIYKMVLDAPKAAKEASCGQFVNLYCDDRSRLLPRPISISDIDEELGTLSLIYAVVGKGTEELAAKKAGDTVRILGPLGHGFETADAAKADRIYIVGGGLGIPPMLNLSKTINCKEKTDIFLGFRSAPFMKEEFESYGTVYPSSDDGACGFQGTTLDRIKQEEESRKKKGESLGKRVLYACGPLPMMKAIQTYFEKDSEIELWFSLEERMGCGIGACAGCPAGLRMPDGTIKQFGVCKMGPVFNGRMVVFR